MVICCLLAEVRVMRLSKVVLLAAILIALGVGYTQRNRLFAASAQRPVINEAQTVQEKKSAELRVKSMLLGAGFKKFPKNVAVLAFKTERRVEVWGQQYPTNEWTLVKTYPILAASGTPGPKLREGDRQVPEGIYRIEYMNPNSSYHLSMKINYPNAFEQQKAEQDGRTHLGGDICIHGWEVSIGCIAVGNVAIEELYYLCDKVGSSRVKVIIAPNDLRVKPTIMSMPAPKWLPELYANIAAELQTYRQSTPALKTRTKS
jgi:murein L,D-transpeptidase YafK